jgi:hypothetical protein
LKRVPMFASEKVQVNVAQCPIREKAICGDSNIRGSVNSRQGIRVGMNKLHNPLSLFLSRSDDTNESSLVSAVLIFQ